MQWESELWILLEPADKIEQQYNTAWKSSILKELLYGSANWEETFSGQVSQVDLVTSNTRFWWSWTEKNEKGQSTVLSVFPERNKITTITDEVPVVGVRQHS